VRVALYCFAVYCIVLFIVFLLFYSASHSISLLEALKATAITVCVNLVAEALQATVSEGLAQGPYVPARAGFEPSTLRSKGFDSSIFNPPPRPTLYRFPDRFIAQDIDDIPSVCLQDVGVRSPIVCSSTAFVSCRQLDRLRRKLLIRTGSVCKYLLPASEARTFVT